MSAIVCEWSFIYCISCQESMLLSWVALKTLTIWSNLVAMAQ